MVDGALTYSDAQVKRDIANLKSAVAKAKANGAFLPVVAPASALPGAKNEHLAALGSVDIALDPDSGSRDARSRERDVRRVR